MRRFFAAAVTAAFFMAGFSAIAAAQSGDGGFNDIPARWKWIGDDMVAFTYDGSYLDSAAFAYDVSKGRTIPGVKAPEKFLGFPVSPEGAVNLTYSPDSTMLAFTRDNDLYVIDIATSEERRLTFDGTDLILNGYASWVYYEEIFGRPSMYRAFWWSPDSRRIGFYRFDNTEVPLFPIYSPFGQDGSLRQTRYPKAGERNPEVRIGVVCVDGLFGGGASGCIGADGGVASNGGAGADGGASADGAESDCDGRPEIVWADFDPADDCYYGTPFWGADSREIYITRMPRRQNTIDLYAVSVSDGSRRHVYNEKYDTWIDWIEDVLFTDSGLYMARSFETGWEQVYFLSYDGSELRRLTDGPNWRIRLLRADERSGEVYFTAQRDSRLRTVLYKVDGRGEVTALTDPAFNVASVSFSPDGRHFAAAISNSATPTKVIVADTRTPSASAKAGSRHSGAKGEPLDSGSPAKPGAKHSGVTVVADMARGDYDPAGHNPPQFVWMTTGDGFELPAKITYPEDFDPQRKYPVHVDIYGGPNTPLVRDTWTTPTPDSRWWSENGIIEVVADCTASGHNGRAGTDLIYRDLIGRPVRDFIAWADWLKALPYVDGDRIGVEGFSFGGTMTAALVFTAPDSYHYGIAGGGVYDWALYDSHYTERFMDTPQNNPEGYAAARVINMVGSYPVNYSIPHGPQPVMLRITHGTGDDNVHFQNTLQLIDELQRQGKEFELMIYPDGMHGYRGYQGEHFNAGNRAFWLKYLKGE